MALKKNYERFIWTSAIVASMGMVALGFQNCAETTFTDAVVAEKATVDGTGIDGGDTTVAINPTEPSSEVPGTNPPIDPDVEVPGTNPPNDPPVNPVPPEDQGVTEIEDPVECVKGKKLGIWLDPMDLGVRYPANYLGDIVAYQGDLTSKENYNYYSASAHPEVGPQPVPFQASVFFYEGSDGLSLNFFANIDADGSDLSRFKWDIKTTGNEMKDQVIVSDDPNHVNEMNEKGAELEIYDKDESSKTQYYKGEFEHYKNTDGGVIGPFQGEDFLIRVLVKSSDDEPKYPIDIEKAKFHSANGGSFSLSTDIDVFSSFVIGFQEYENCEE